LQEITQPMNGPWRITLFGGLCIQQDERVITRFKSQKVGALLAYLAYHLRQIHSREVLIDLFWPDSALEAGRNSLSVALSTLRHQLEPPGTPANAVIRADRFSVGLNPAAVMTDVAEFEKAAHMAAKAASATERMQLLVQAVALYPGRLLPGYYEEWIGAEQERLAGLFFDSVDKLIVHLEETGDLSSALQYARHAASLDPLREESYQSLLRLLAAAGQPGAALRQYKEMERLLEAELGVEPSAPLRALARQIEKQSGGEYGSKIVSTSAGTTRAMAFPHSPAETSASVQPVTLTFLMTDIEIAPRLWEHARETFPTALERHHALLRREFARCGGQEIKEAGNSFLVAFQSAGKALACAIASQQALAAQSWPEETGPLKVRMALHTGDVEYGDGEYHGLVLHWASRMLTAAHGGQILCSEATAGLLRRDLSENVRLVDLGVYRLRDVPTPERLFQVEYPDMAAQAFPPIHAEAGYAANLPLQFTRFFGREQEITKLVELLTPGPPATVLPCHLVTLTGPGGTGKTRLAIAVAERLIAPYQGAVWFAPLADLSDPGRIADAVLNALRLPRSPDQEPLDQVVEALAEQPSLLVLDCFEHLVKGGVEMVQTLLERVPSLKCLVTSRQLLGLSIEQEFPVLPLPTPGATTQSPHEGGAQGGWTPERLTMFDSVALFVDRAQAVMPYFQVTNSNAPAVAELCHRLEGIPLAIELAAARALVMTPAQMLSQLEQRFAFLVSRRRDMSERHRTLRATVEWSYRLLPPELQRFFARLSVFRDGWVVEAAEAVCEEPLALDYLAQLRECSLVLTEENGLAIRFRLLEMLREYGQEQLTPEDRESARRRHAEYYLAAAEQAEPQLVGAEQARWLESLEAEHDNLRAGLEWCLAEENRLETGLRLTGALWRFWSIRGYAREGRRLMETLLERVPAAHPTLGSSPVRARSLDGAGALAHDMGDYAAAAAFLEQSLALWRENGGRHQVANALNLLANVVLDRGDDAAAAPLYEEALALYRETGDRRGTAMVLGNLGALALDRGETARAAELLGESLRLKRPLGNKYGLAMSLEHLANVEQRLGDYARAAGLHAEALALRRELGHKQGIAMSLNNLGHVLLAQGQIETAVGHLHDSLALFDELADRDGLAECLANMAGVIGAAVGHEPSARLAGAVAALRAMHGLQLTTAEITVEETLQAPVKEGLGKAAYAKAWKQGEAMSLEEAVAFARAHLSGQP
jgi:predicted ATPase/DNA-binding SARP family transcriptional activator